MTTEAEWVDAPATEECPDHTTCVHCGEPIHWDDYGYIHNNELEPPNDVFGPEG